MNRIRRFLRLPFAEQALFLEACVGLTIALIRIRLATLLGYERLLGAIAADAAPDDGRKPDAHALARVSQAVARAAHHHPARPTCLPQALAARHMLRRRGLASTLILGLARKPDGALQAHAWLDAGGVHVTGGAQAPAFVPIQRFVRSAVTP